MTVICVSGEKSYKPNMVDLKFALVLENSLLVFPVIYVNSNMMLMIVLAILYSATFAASVPQNYYNQQYPSKGPTGQNVVPIVSETNEINPDGSFSYSYTTGDGQQAQAQGFLKNPGNKETEAEVIQGSYSYTAPDGQTITVNYIADELGFRATGAHLPTPPPIPEAIKKSLELIARVQQNQPKGQSSYDSSSFQSPRYQDQDDYESQGEYQAPGYRRPYSRSRY